jgi:hypothetical protein
MRKILVVLMVLGGLAYGQSYTMKSGETAPIISVFMTKIADGTTAIEVTEDAIDVTYWESGVPAAAVTYTDTADVALNAAYTSKGIKWIGGGWYRFDPPIAALDSGVGKSVVFYLTNATYEGHVLIQLTPPGDAVLVNGTTPQESPANFSAFAVEASTGAVTTTATSNTAIAAAVVEGLGSASSGSEIKATAQLTAGTMLAAWANVYGTVTMVDLEIATASLIDGAYDNKYISFFDSSGKLINTAFIYRYNGNSAPTQRAYLQGDLLHSAVTDGVTTYVIRDEIPLATGSDFGPNAKVAVLEKDGAGAGTTLSTTTTIYLTANSYDTTLYASGMRVVFADTSGIYHYGIISTNVSDVLTLRTESTGTPANLTPIYSLGPSVANAVWDELTTGHDEANTYGGYLHDIYDITSALSEICLTDLDLLNESGNTKTTLTFAGGIGGAKYDLRNAPIRFYDATNTKSYYRIVVSHNITTATITVFPALPVIATAHDKVYLYSQFGGMIPSDLAKIPN